MERRVALPPVYVKKLVDQGFDFAVESSAKRIFTDQEFRDAGAVVTDSLADRDVIFGVKEMPISFFEENKTYIFFSHVIKGQSYNMPMLRQMMAKKCNLIEYEKIEDNKGRRLIFFGRFAGLAGMINSFWSLGQRLKIQGMETPFTKVKQSHKYNSLAEAEKDIIAVGEAIKAKGLPNEITPLTIGYTGYGNVSRGAQHIASHLPSVDISPDELLKLKESGKYSNKVVYKVVFKEEDLSEPIDAKQTFELSDYYKHPKKYKNQFEKYPPHLTILMNCMYWNDHYPRLITKDYIADQFAKGEPKLKVIGDITCDPDGSIEFLHKGTEIQDPVFVYDPVKRKPTMGFEGYGILMMAVDILPSELPRESSESFGAALEKFVPAIASADYTVAFDALDLPEEIKGAMILYQGKLTPKFRYIKEYLK
jgi:alpha-aminoadipic semialdehyde synthase